MKTLIFNGSPRKNGDTAGAVKNFISGLRGEYKTVDAYNSRISPCVDCRYCREKRGCCIDDDMQEVYKYIEECDNILIASPIYFSELTGRMLDVGSRLQMYYSAQFFGNEDLIKKKKKGAVILVGGGDGNIEKPFSTARILLRQMGVTDIFPAVYSHNTDAKSASADDNLLSGINDIVKFFEG
jgi:multimeric flavodoxin WrbA